ncbi:MAG: adenosine kinase [Alphaproteobacteria bacterium]|nr:adenosine kinase [Alphaproteobacteria bacterium]
MNQPCIDVLGIGNAIVDIVAEVDESFLAEFDLAKDGMHLVDHDMATRLLDACEPVTMMSGGSVANTIAGLAAIGGNGGFVGRVKDDTLGQRFAGDLRSQGVVFATPAAADGPETGRSLILVTPDGHRTMCTWLGASVDLGVADLEADAMSARVVLLEGYLMDAPEGHEVFRKAAGMAAPAGGKVAMSLSDAACVDRHRDDLHPFLHDHVDIVFANEAETLSLFPGESFSAASRGLADEVSIAVVTRSEKGSMVFSPGSVFEIESVMTKVVDATGAGDLYAAGFLYGYTQELSLDRAARIANVCSSEVIGQFGARVTSDLRASIARTLG